MPLTSTGLTIKRLPEIKEELLENERQNIDANISGEDNDVLGQLNSIFAAALAEAYELAEAVNDNFNINTAEGQNLDDLAALISLKRLAAEKSFTEMQHFIGQDGTEIPTGSIIDNPVTDDRFFTVGDVLITTESCLSVLYSVQTLLNETLYTINVNGTDYEYTSDYDATELEVLNGLKTQIDGDGNATWTATVDAGDLTLLIETDDENELNVTAITYLTPNSVTVKGTVEAENTGELVVPPNSVTEIVSAVEGWDSTTNPDSYTVGRDLETDEAFRERIKSSQQNIGKSTPEAIRDAVANVDGVSFARVIENDTMEDDIDGRPPKSFETLVQGGTDADVAQAIWESKPAGIATFGNTSELVEDSNGDEHTINFSRPTVINIAIRATYTLYDEEVFPSGGEAAMAAAILAYIETLVINEDVIPGRLYGPIYDSTAGLEDLTVEVQAIANPGDAPVGGSWQSTKLEIAFDETAETTALDIYIVGP